MTLGRLQPCRTPSQPCGGDPHIYLHTTNEDREALAAQTVHFASTGSAVIPPRAPRSKPFPQPSNPTPAAKLLIEGHSTSAARGGGGGGKRQFVPGRRRALALVREVLPRPAFTQCASAPLTTVIDILWPPAMTIRRNNRRGIFRPTDTRNSHITGSGPALPSGVWLGAWPRRQGCRAPSISMAGASFGFRPSFAFVIPPSAPSFCSLDDFCSCLRDFFV